MKLSVDGNGCEIPVEIGKYSVTGYSGLGLERKLTKGLELESHQIPREALGGKTPSEVAGIKVEGTTSG